MVCDDLIFLVVIGNKKLKKNLVHSLVQIGASLFNTVYGRGFLKTSNFFESIGFVNENTKVIIMCLMKRVNCDQAFEMLNSKFNFDKPNTGIAFSIPVDTLKIEI